MLIFFQSREKARQFASNIKAKGIATASVKDNKAMPSVKGSRYAVEVVKRVHGVVS